MAQCGLAFDFREEFFSVSGKDVIRGMHFQTPPHDHDKMVYCARGAVLDVLLDLRPGPGYGVSRGIELRDEEPRVLFIPRGVAHGFLALTAGALMVYKTSAEHAPVHDRGIRFDSFGFDWGCQYPVISERDLGHPAFRDFVSPFNAA